MLKTLRQCYIKDGLCYIPLQNGQEAFTNKEYYDIVSQHNWSASKNAIVTIINNKTIILSKFLFNYVNKVNYLNKNNLDCRKENVIELKRKCYIEDGVCKIPLNNGQIAICDADRFDEVNKYNWIIHSLNYAATSIKRKHILLHRFLYPEWKLIDHINHNGLDNRSYNLREATQHQNSMNSKLNKNSNTKYKGVSYFTRDNKYEAYINFNYKKIHLGKYPTPEEAAEAYNKKAKELFGEYACLNVIPKKKKSIF
jgi:hypothetical protein